jgi:hypothetical protein
VTVAEAWASFRVAVVGLVAQVLRVDLVESEQQFFGQDTPYATQVQSRLIRGSLDATIAAVWPLAVTDFEAARSVCRTLLMHLVVVMEVPLVAVAYELAELYPDVFIDGDDVVASDFLGADVFSELELEPGQLSIREEIHSFIAEALETSPEGAVQVLRTFANRWSADEVMAAEQVTAILAHLLASLAHRAATDALLEGADEAG